MNRATEAPPCEILRKPALLEQKNAQCQLSAQFGIEIDVDIRILNRVERLSSVPCERKKQGKTA